MGVFIDLTGKEFGKLTVIKRIIKDKRTRWLCQCKCGKEVIVIGDNLKREHTTSCGCFDNERRIKHGDSNTRLYNIWWMMISRCENPHNERHKNGYFDKGIKVCPEWHDYITFKTWAINNGYTDYLSIDRIDNDGNYTPENCRWADIITQANNTSLNVRITYKGETKTLTQWANILRIKPRTLSARILTYKWDIGRAFTEKVHSKRAIKWLI